MFFYVFSRDLERFVLGFGFANFCFFSLMAFLKL